MFIFKKNTFYFFSNFDGVKIALGRSITTESRFRIGMGIG